MLSRNITCALIVLLSLVHRIDSALGQDEYDVVIYGGTSAGIAAAVQVSRMGHSVIVIEPSRRIGGLTTGGLGHERTSLTAFRRRLFSIESKAS